MNGKTAIAIRLLVALSLATWLAGCGQNAAEAEADLEPQTGDGSIAESTVQGVDFEVDTAAWDGSPVVSDLLTPIRVSVTNHSDQPLRIRYANFALLGAYDRYAALPPLVLQRQDDVLVLAAGGPVVDKPELDYTGFFVAPYYAPAYPRLSPYEGSLMVDEDYYRRYLAVWSALPGLPDEEIARKALPEGVLATNASVSGFLYFERVADGEEKVNFMAQAENAETHDYFGTALIPLENKDQLL